MSVNAGDAAPEVTVEAYVRDEAQPVQIEVGGPGEAWTVLFFYPRDFTFLCPAELRAFAELQASFALEGASVMAASTDSWHVHRAWLETSSGLTGIRYPVLADPDAGAHPRVRRPQHGRRLGAPGHVHHRPVRDRSGHVPGRSGHPAPAGRDARGAARAAHERAPGCRLTLRG